MTWKTINVTQETWERLQALASGFRSDDLGTPAKVIAYLLDEYESNTPPPEDNS